MRYNKNMKIKKIKKNVTLIILSVFSICFFSCASSENKANEKNQSLITIPEEVKKEIRFDDWKYKGFGYEMPIWVEDAIDGNLKNALTLIERGINPDHSENKIAEKESQVDLGIYELIGSTWVREKLSGEYISIRVYNLIIEEVVE